jgi:hypothetical protein
MRLFGVLQIFRGHKMRNATLSLARLMFILSIFTTGFFAFSFVCSAADAAPTALKSVNDVLGDKPDVLPGFGRDSSDASSKVNYIVFRIVDVLLILAGILAVFFITLSGVRFVVGVGSQSQLDAAKRTLLWSVLGLIAVILSWALVTNVIKVLFTNEESTGSACREIGCTCFSDSDCDSGECDSEGGDNNPLKVCK